jgi:uncharacterized protein involved in outer membrane biogenesis
MKSLRKLFLFVAVIVALAAAGLIESFNLLAAKHRDQVTQELQKVLGQDVSFESLEVNLFGRPGFVAKEFRIADDSRFAATPALRARELVLGVSLWNLLLRRLVITSLTFNEPEFQIITDESGLLNLTALINRKTELRKFPRLRQQPAAPERRQVPVNFAIHEVAIKRGSIEYVDRSVKQPAELRVRNVSMSVKGFDPDEATKINIAASLTEGLGHDVRISGELARPPENHSWLQRSVDLSVQFDSLHVPVVARAIAFMRDKIPSQLDVTGPMSLQAKMRGTAEQPRLEDITLKVPLFGSSEYNAVITGGIKFTERRTWEDADLGGSLTIDPLSLVRLRNFKIFEQTLPEALITEGNVKIYGRFAGTWENLRLGALVRADKAEVRYQDWLRKPVDAPATIRAQISRRKQKLIVHESELSVGANKIDFSGGIDHDLTPRLLLTLRSHGGSVATWGQFLSVPSFEAVGGKADLDVTLNRSLIGHDAQWSLLGGLKLSDAAFKHRASGRSVDNVQAAISFDGIKARLQNGRFRLGTSVVFLSGSTANIFEPRLVSTVRSPDLVLADLPLLSPKPAVRLKDVLGQTEIFLENNHWVLTGSLAAPQGNLNDWPLRDLRADIALAPSGLTFKNFRAQTLNGVLRAEGFWPAKGETARQLQFTSQVDAVEVPALLAQLFPPIRDRIEGLLNGQGQFEVDSSDGLNMREALKGSGEASLQHGAIKNFNLVSQLMMKGSGSGVSAATMSRVPPGFAALFNRPDTPIESMKASFTIEQKRVFTENLVITTPDYTITGAGWIGFNRQTRWNGLIVLSPRLTQEVQRDYRIIRYLLDRRGRLAIAFRIDGEIPNVSIRLENRALAQALRTGTGQKGSGADGQGSDGNKEGRNWLPDALERFLKR